MKRTRNTKRLICAAALSFLVFFSGCSTNNKVENMTMENGTVIQSTTTEQTVTTEHISIAEQSTSTEQITVVDKKTFSTEIVLATLNIAHGAAGLDVVAQAIREISPDIIGLQEVDVGCERSGYVDEVAELARLAGYDYHVFFKAIPLGDGEYGTALLSRYPIESFDVTPLESGGGERRSVGHAVICIEEMKLDVLVTHLSYEDRSVRIEQMKTIGKMLKNYDRYVLTGDFNCFDLGEMSNLEGAYYVSRPDRRYASFRRYSSFAPDNIVVSDGFVELSSGMSEAECSDHKMIYATFMLSGE